MSLFTPFIIIIAFYVYRPINAEKIKSNFKMGIVKDDPITINLRLAANKTLKFLAKKYDNSNGISYEFTNLSKCYTGDDEELFSFSVGNESCKMTFGWSKKGFVFNNFRVREKTASIRIEVNKTSKNSVEIKPKNLHKNSISELKLCPIVFLPDNENRSFIFTLWQSDSQLYPKCDAKMTLLDTRRTDPTNILSIIPSIINGSEAEKNKGVTLNFRDTNYETKRVQLIKEDDSDTVLILFPNPTSCFSGDGEETFTFSLGNDSCKMTFTWSKKWFYYSEYRFPHHVTPLTLWLNRTAGGRMRPLGYQLEGLRDYEWCPPIYLPNTNPQILNVTLWQDSRLYPECDVTMKFSGNWRLLQPSPPSTTEDTTFVVDDTADSISNSSRPEDRRSATGRTIAVLVVAGILAVVSALALCYLGYEWMMRSNPYK